MRHTSLPAKNSTKAPILLLALSNKKKSHSRKYISRFNVAILEVRYLNQSMAMIALKGRLQRNAFPIFIEERYSRDFIEMLARVKKHVNVEETGA